VKRGSVKRTSFRPGVSGNPGGRPKKAETIETRKNIADVKELAKEMTPKAMKALEDVLDSETAPPAAKVSASVILDRGWGKPKQSIEGQVGLTFERMIVMATEREERQTLPAGPTAKDE
jgi:Family of unknown function (DUF5681)